MIVLLSPAKSLDLTPLEGLSYTQSEFASKASGLIRILKKYSKDDLQKLMKISDNLARENVLRYKSFRRSHTIENSKQALYAFSGDVYRGLDAGSLEADDIDFAQDHIRILSGLYGILKPLDLIQPYRLEMGSSLPNPKGKNLYAYWDRQITNALNRQIKTANHRAVVNLASHEYSRVVDFKRLKAKIVHIRFKEYRNDELKFLSFNAKRARGLMARYIVQNRIRDIESLKGFNSEGYFYSAELSNETDFLFIR